MNPIRNFSVLVLSLPVLKSLISDDWLRGKNWRCEQFCTDLSRKKCWRIFWKIWRQTTGDGSSDSSGWQQRGIELWINLLFTVHTRLLWLILLFWSKVQRQLVVSLTKLRSRVGKTSRSILKVRSKVTLALKSSLKYQVPSSHMYKVRWRQVNQRHSGQFDLSFLLKRITQSRLNGHFPKIKTLDWERHLHFTLPFHFTLDPSPFPPCIFTALATWQHCTQLGPPSWRRSLSTVFLSFRQLYFCRFVNCICLSLSSCCGKLAAVYSTEACSCCWGTLYFTTLSLALPMIQSPHLPNTLLGFKPKHTEANRIDRNLQNFLPCAFNASSKCGRRILHNIP